MDKFFDQRAHYLVYVVINDEVGTYKNHKNGSDDNEPILSFYEKIPDGFF